MKKIESNCYDCGLPCLRETCTHYQMTTNCCDICGEYAYLRLDGLDYCDQHARKYLQDVFDSMSILEKAEALHIDTKLNEGGM